MIDVYRDLWRGIVNGFHANGRAIGDIGNYWPWRP